MAAASNRAPLIEKTFRVLKKKYSPVPSVERSILENLLYACGLENTRFELADECFARIQETFFDWNEVRVTTVRELAELMSGVANPVQAATNLKHTLHSVFEAQYEFDLESLRKQNLGVAIKQIESYRGVTPFAASFAVQHALGGHSIPICEGSLDLMQIIGVITESEYANRKVPGLERAIAKTKGIEFASLLHQLAAAFVASPFNNEVRGIILEISPDAKERLPKRARKKTEPEKKETAKKSTTKKKKKTTTTAAPKKATKKAAEKPSVAKKKTKAAKKSATKKLTKRKPR